MDLSKNRLRGQVFGSLHFAWLVVVAAAVISMATSGLRLAFGVFLDPLDELFGWSRSASSFANFLMFFVMGLGSLWVGRLSDRFGARRVILVAVALFTAGMLLMADVDSLWELYLYYGLMIGLASSAFITPVHATVSRWFDKGLGVAIGLVVAAQAIGPLAMAPLLRYFVASLGWRDTFFLAALTAPLMLAAAWFMRDRPQDLGLLPVGGGDSWDHRIANESDRRPEAEGEASSAEALLREAKGTKPYRILPAVHWLGCVGHNLPLVHVVSMATAAGVAGVTAAGVLGLVFGASIISRFGMAVLADRVGGRTALALTLTLQAVGVLILFPAAHFHPLYYVFAIVFGIGFGGEMTSFPVINRELFHERVIGSVYGVQMFGAAFGMALGGQIGGVLYDLTGGYTSAIWFSFAMSAIGVLAVLRLPARRQAKADAVEAA